MDVLKKCVPLKERKSNQKKCSEKEWEIRGRIGESSVFGEVYISCCKQKCDSVMKIQKLGRPGEAEETNRESEIQYLMAEKGIAPKISYSNICEGNSVIIMDALTRTSWDFMQETKDPEMNRKILVQIIRVIEKIHALGYVHGDAHLQNFMVTYDQKEYEKIISKNPLDFSSLDFQTFAIDFGKSIKTEDPSERRLDYEKMAVDLMKRYEDAEWNKGREEEYSQNLMLVFQKLN